MTLLELVAYLQKNGIALEWRDNDADPGEGIVWPVFPPGRPYPEPFFEPLTIEPFCKWMNALKDAHWQTHTRVSA